MNPSKIWLVARYEFVTTLQRRSVLFAMFGLPLLTVLILTGLNWLNREVSGEDAGTNPLAALGQLVISERDNRLTGLVDETGQIKIFPTEMEAIFLHLPSLVAAEEAFRAGTIQGYYLIPPDYLTSGQIAYFADRLSVQNDWIEDSLYRLLVMNAVSNATVAERVIVPAYPIETDLTADTAVQEPDSILQANILGFTLVVLFYLTAMGTAGFLLQSMGKEKENRVIEILLSSIRPRELLTGKMFGLGAIGLLEMVVWLLIGQLITSGGQPLFANLSLPTLPAGKWVLVFLYFAAGFLVYASLYAGLGAISPNPKESGSFTFFIMLPTFVPMWLMNILIQAPNGGGAVGMSLFPLTAPLAMPIRLTLTNVPAWQLVLGLAITLLTSLATIVLAARLFHSRTLLSGQPLSFRSLWQTLSQPA